MRNKYISLVALSIASITMAIGASQNDINMLVESTENPELIKFLAPLVAGVIGKFLEQFFGYLKDKRKDKNVD